MTEQLQQKTVIDPSLSDVLALQKIDIFGSLNCVKLGQITSFDGTKRTATIQILFKRQLPDGTAVSYPLLLDCPVFTLQGGGGFLQMPVAAGDQCIILFSDRNIDNWYQTGTQSVPPSTRMHDMSDAIALVGVDPLSSSLPVYPTDKVVLSYLGSRFELTATGWNFVGTGGAEIDLGTLVLIKNNVTTLKIVMDTLITAIEAIQVTGPLPLTPASVTALEAARTLMGTLLA